MPRWSRSAEARLRALLGSDADGERGSAPIEFIFVGLLLLVPLVYLIVALGTIQGQALGAEAGARQIARVVATSGDPSASRTAADAALRTIIDEYGMDAGAVDLAMACRPATASCPAAGATLSVTVRTQVSLPLVPEILGLDRLARIPIEASAAQRVSRFWSAQ